MHLVKRFFLPMLLMTTSWVSMAQSSGYFKHFPVNASPQMIGKKLSERFITTAHSLYGMPPGAAKPSFITYPDACAWYGAFEWAAAANDQAIIQKLLSKSNLLLNEESRLIPKPNHVDNSVFGIVPLAAYLQGKDLRFLKIGLEMADAQFKKLTDAEMAYLKPDVQQWYKNGLSWQTRFWIDDMFMMTALQTEAARASGNRAYLDPVAKEMVAYLDRLQNPDGLFFHSPDAPFYWSRGNGWMAVGMAILLDVLPVDHSDRPRIMKGYQLMMSALLKYQDDKGLWHQLIDDPQAWTETSGSGMFTCAFILGVKNGWLPAKTYGPAARKAWMSLVTYLDANGDLTSVCEGTNKKNNHQYYLDRKRNTGDLHGQAAVLWCAAALLR